MKNVTDFGCTAQNRKGEFCDAPSYPDMPYPICAKHALEVWRRVMGHIEAHGNDPGVRMRALNSYLDDSAAKSRARTVPSERPQVYYLQIGDLIKIGRTKNLRQRMNSYGPAKKLLALEAGDVDLEQERLRQFAHLLEAGREWFRPGPDLIKHVNALRKANGASPVKLKPAAH